MNVSEVFYSIQGEGTRIGERTVFLRCSNCNLKCKWCDTKYSWVTIKELSVEVVADKVMEYLKEHNCERLCITGGEPMLQQNALVKLSRLIDPDIYLEEVSVETNCTIVPGDDVVHELEEFVTKWTVSPKLPSSGETFDKDVFEYFRLNDATEWKFVIQDVRDYEEMKRLLNGLCGPVILQPVAKVPFDLLDYLAQLKWLTQKVLEDRLPVKVLPQIHKLMYTDRRGV